jgi:hypothetical protein
MATMSANQDKVEIALELSKHYVVEAAKHYKQLGYPLKVPEMTLPDYVASARRLLFELASCYGQVLTVVSMYYRGMPINVQMLNPADYETFTAAMRDKGVTWSDIATSNVSVFRYSVSGSDVLEDGTYELRSLLSFIADYVEMIVVVLQLWLEGVSSGIIYNRIRMVNVGG